MQFFHFLSPSRFLLLQTKPLQLIHVPTVSIFLTVVDMQYWTADTKHAAQVRSSKYGTTSLWLN